MKRLLAGLAAGCIAMGLLSGCDSGSEGETIGPRGGVVASPDARLTLELPAGALDLDLAITIDTIEDGPADAVGPTYEILPRGTVLNLPAMLTYDVSEGMRASPREIIVVTESAYGWSALPDFHVDMDALVLRASVLYLSAYAPVTE